jgi:hypothetical protein
MDVSVRKYTIPGVRSLWDYGGSYALQSPKYRAMPVRAVPALSRVFV